MYQQYFAEIPVNPTCVLLQSASADGTADMHCLLIDPNKNGELATTISCYDDLGASPLQCLLPSMRSRFGLVKKLSIMIW